MDNNVGTLKTRELVPVFCAQMMMKPVVPHLSAFSSPFVLACVRVWRCFLFLTTIYIRGDNAYFGNMFTPAGRINFKDEFLIPVIG